MTTLAKVFSAVFHGSPIDPEVARHLEMDREWDRLRASAISPAERAEIDAIFARSR